MTMTAREEWRRNWPTVLVAAFGMSCSTLYIYSAGAFVGPIQADTGWSRAAIGSGITVVTVIAALVNPLVGAAVDRFGARRLALLAITLQPAAFAAIAMTRHSMESWWLHWALLGVLGFAMTPSTWTAAVAALFDRSRGLALAVTMSGMGVGSIVIPPISTLLVGSYGWRSAFLGLGLIWGGIGLPLVILLMRDGRGGRSDASVRPAGAPIRQALVSVQFLALVGAVLFFTFVSMSFVISIIPVLVWQGFRATTAAGLASMFGISAIVGRLTTGFLLDRIDPRVVTATAMGLPVAAVGLLWSMPGVIGAASVAILVMGLSLGAEIDGIAYLISRYFGVRNYALLFGITISASSLATAAAPLVSGRIYDVTGRYDLLLLVMILPCAASALAVALMGRPPSPSPPAELPAPA